MRTNIHEETRLTLSRLIETVHECIDCTSVDRILGQAILPVSTGSWGKLFYLLATLSLKEKCLVSDWLRDFISFIEWPLVRESVDGENKAFNDATEIHLMIFKSSIKSDRFLLSSKDHKFNFFSQSLWSKFSSQEGARWNGVEPFPIEPCPFDSGDFKPRAIFNIQDYKTFIELCHYFSVPGGYWLFKVHTYCSFLCYGSTEMRSHDASVTRPTVADK